MNLTKGTAPKWSQRAYRRPSIWRIFLCTAGIVGAGCWWLWVGYSESAIESDIYDIYADDDFPLRQAEEPWNIATSYNYPRHLSKEVTEGTWLRIATHPLQDEIVFDMLGDLYCMSTQRRQDSPFSEARAFLRGVPYDKEASFSSDGQILVFISDAGFGVDNIWTIRYSNCDDMVHRASRIRDEAIQQTNSTFRFFSSPTFHPSEAKILATKWYLTGRPNGAGEIWETPVQFQQSIQQLPERGGRRVIGRKLPATWSREQYFESQLGAEQARYVGGNGDGIIFTRNIRDDATGKFSYGKDVHRGVNAIFLHNTTTGSTEILVDAFPGGANMPRMSHDGQTLAFVRRVQDKEVLVLKDMHSGTIHHIWDGLTYDLSLIPAFMGAYSNYGFTAGDDSIVIWAQGHIFRVPLTFNALHERVAGSVPERLDFTARIELALGATRYSETDIRKVELQDEARLHSFRGLRSDEHGDRVIFEAAGETYVLDVTSGQLSSVAGAVPDAAYYHPSFVPVTSCIVHARWDDRNLTSFEMINTANGERGQDIKGLPKGRYLSPVIGHGKIAYVRTGKDLMLGDVEETAGEGVWLGDIELSTLCDASATSPGRESAVVTNLRRVDTHAFQDIRLSFQKSENHLALLIQAGDGITQVDVGGGVGKTLVRGKTSTEMAVGSVPRPSYLQSLFSRKSDAVAVAFRDFQNIWLGWVDAPTTVKIWSKPGDRNTPQQLVKLSSVGGHDVAFSDDGERVFWLFGSTLHHTSVSTISKECASLNAHRQTACVSRLVRSEELVVTYETDLAKMKSQSHGLPLVLTNATLIPMADGQPLTIPHGTITLQNGKIIDVGRSEDVKIPASAHIVDLAGGAVMPGYVDAHAHWASFLTPYPFTSWEHETFLGYGITTLHNPSSRTLAGPWERALVEKGMKYGGRLYNVGEVLYGSTQPSVYTEINSMDDAHAALLRQKIEGGDSMFSVKNYQLSRRSARQRLLMQAAEMNMLIVPEGGFSFDWDLTYFIDGMTTLEHPVPIPELYDDVLSLIEASGSSYTQVAVMNYGGLFGQDWVHETFDIVNDEKMRKYIKHDVLEKLSEVVQAPLYDYQFFNTTISAKKLKDRGVRTNIGAHGEQPIGFLYHKEMEMHHLGGQTPYQVLRAATIEGARSLGLQSAIGSLEAEKMADLVIYPPGVDTVERVWTHSMHARYVMRGGRLFEVEDGLVEIWPRKGRRQDRRRINPEDE